jgi:hypothetical protein
LSFEGHEAWAEAIGAETDTDAGAKPIRLAGTEVKRIDATKSARIVARTLVLSPLSSLEGRSLGQIQDWRDRDEQIVGRIREALRSDIKAKRYRRLKGHYAAHVVAAAVYEATQVRTADLPKIQERMLALLKHMHNANPAWGPLFLSRILGVKRQVAHRMERARRARPKRRRR